MDDKLSIKVNVADRYYPLKIERKDEEKIRKAARLINEKVLQYKQRYLDKDVQDFLAMAALQFVTRVIEMEERIDVAPLQQQLQDLNEELETYLGKGE
ncbi:MAG TPA: cell division protein ZapA [Bacteroidales bacterium]|jgi:cell division protein ZapA|nr:cell division protein ZapA [Bacteroidales bacterium]